MANEGINKCFVVMPFGTKPFNDGTGRTYDFDKVYRIVIRRAIEEAGMKPIRADEAKGSDLIHREMFRELRDRSVVLADLSLYNPNVFYELGIRHVLSSAGTVLMCCQVFSDLPFDVNLSRVNFYDFDGINFDWEEVERVVQLLRDALTKAKSGVPDSPVHALLESVFPVKKANSKAVNSMALKKEDSQSLGEFQKIVAKFWLEKGETFSSLKQQTSIWKSIFGIRSIGYMCLETECDQKQTKEIAKASYNAEQYDIAVKIYEKLDNSGMQLGIKDLLKFGSAISEEPKNIMQANEGLRIQTRALELVQPRLKAEKPDLKTLKDAARCYHELGGMHRWKWTLAKEDKDLESAIAYYEKALDYGNLALEIGNKFSMGNLANFRLKLLVLLRIKDKDPKRFDHENHREEILKLIPSKQQKEEDISYLSWYKAITYADLGDKQSLQECVFNTFAEDGLIMNKPEMTSVGRRQYTRIRRFIEEFFTYLRNPNLMGYISQKLQTPHKIR